MNEFFEALGHLYASCPALVIGLIIWWLLNAGLFAYMIGYGIKMVFTLIEMGIMKLSDKIRGIKSEK